jgi:hypothetical protein
MAVSGKRRAREAKLQRRRARDRAAAKQGQVKPWSTPESAKLSLLEFAEMVLDDTQPIPAYAMNFMDLISDAHVSVDLSAPVAHDGTVMQHIMNGWIDLGITHTDGAMWYYGALSDDGITITRDWDEPPSYEKTIEDVMLPEQDTIVDPRGLLHVELE